MKEIKSAVKLQVQRHVLGPFLGMYRSLFRGKGIEYDEIRKFVPGDDIKDIVWAKLAQMGEAYVKTYLEERDLVVLVALDISGSMFWGRSKKAELACETAALLLFSGAVSRDRVGLVLFSDQVDRFISPRRGLQHVGKLIEAVAAVEPAKRKTSLSASLRSIAASRGPKHAVIFLISDFVCPSDAWKEELFALSRRNDVILVRVEDLFEHSPETVGWVYAEDAESGGARLIDCNATFASSMQQKIADVANDLRRSSALQNIGYMEIVEGEEPVKKIRDFFARRCRVLRRR